MNLLAGITRRIIRLPFLRKHYYGIYIKVFRPLGLFRNTSLIHSYDEGMKIKLDIGDWLQQQIYFFDAFDERGLLFLKRNLKEGDVFVDVGANIGGYTLVAARLVGETGKVIAFEPVKFVYDRLCFNIDLNKLGNVSAEKSALYKESGTLTLHVSDRENMGMSSIFHHDTESGQTEKADAIALDDYIKTSGIKKIKLIKIDVEGAELEALKGMQRILRDLRPIIIAEVSDEVLQNDPARKQETIGWLKGMGYERKWLGASGQTMAEPDQHAKQYFNFVFFPGENL